MIKKLTNFRSKSHRKESAVN